MPIGKNSLKRVTGAKIEAPKIEKSTVALEKTPKIEAKSEPKKERVKKVAATNVETKKAELNNVETEKAMPKKEATKKMSARKVTPKKSMEAEPLLSPVKTAEKVIAKPINEQKRQGDGYVNLGGELPYYLL